MSFKFFRFDWSCYSYTWSSSWISTTLFRSSQYWECWSQRFIVRCKFQKIINVSFLLIVIKIEYFSKSLCFHHHVVNWLSMNLNLNNFSRKNPKSKLQFFKSMRKINFQGRFWPCWKTLRFWRISCQIFEGPRNGVLFYIHRWTLSKSQGYSCQLRLRALFMGKCFWLCVIDSTRIVSKHSTSH